MDVIISVNDKSKKRSKIFGGPLDGQTRLVESTRHIYKHEQPPMPEDLHVGEVPVGFFPPMHEYTYEETPPGSGIFLFKEQHHQ